MFEKIRVSLWDIFTFFLSGLVIAMWVLAALIAFQKISITGLLKVISDFPASISLFLAPISLMVIGLLFEPFANYFDKIINIFWYKFFSIKKSLKDEEERMSKLIKNKYLGGIAEEIDNPYQICKEYVETKQLSTTYMVFLSRFGFYRNAFLLSFISAIFSLICFFDWKGGLLSFAFIVVAFVMKRRSQDFYSYLAPSIYHCFLIDKALSGDVKEDEFKG